MKGVIAKCLGEMIEKKYGRDKWEKVLTSCGMPAHKRFLANDDVDDPAVMAAVGKSCEVLNISLEKLADEFGLYWCTEFAPRLYGVYFQASKTAREFLLRMDDVHVATTKNIAGSRPPRFDYTWKNDDTLVMHYRSSRNLRVFLLGLVKGVGAYFGEHLEVSPLGEDKVEVRFPREKQA